jgi:CRISPR/Cas system-associated protein Csm6
MDFVTPLLGLLVPHLPALLMKAAEDVVGEGAKKAVYEAVPGGVKAIWAKLRPKVEASAIAKASADQVVAQPEDQDAQVMLRLALKKVLEDLAKTEPALMAELQALLTTAQQEAGGGKNAGTISAKAIYGLVQGDYAQLTQNFGTQPTED